METAVSLRHVPLFQRLGCAGRVLIAGAGGGFDILAGLPLAFALRAMAKQVFLANLTFTYLGGTDVHYLAPHLARVTPETRGEDAYFPERYLCQWLATLDQDLAIDPVVYCFEKTGVTQLLAGYRALARELDIDALLLIDGGTDILMRGDEAGLGTPAEDMASLAAASALDLPVRLVSCLGFGIDAFHGVCHAHFLENTAALAAAGGYLGAHSLTVDMHETRLYQRAVDYVHQAMPVRQSIVNGSILSALEGHFGDHHRTERTRSSELFINPLMCLYFNYDLAAVARRCLYLDQLAHTESIFQVQALIEAFRKTVTIRPRQTIPV